MTRKKRQKGNSHSSERWCGAKIASGGNCRSITHLEYIFAESLAVCEANTISAQGAKRERKMNDDLISRQAAIESLGEEPEVWTGKDEYEMGLNNQWHYDRNAIMTVPAQERKKGKWTERKVIEDGKAIEEWQSARCSVCGKIHTTPYLYYFDDFAYCPSCGAEMEKGESNAEVH